MNLLKKFKQDLKIFMREMGMSKTAFGIEAVDNPHAIALWLEGKRIPRLDSADEVYAFMEKRRAEKNVPRAE